MHAGLISATPEGKKELVGFQTGVRESAQSWRFEIAPNLAIGDGALGFWNVIGARLPPVLGAVGRDQ